jgi:aspartate beta-hydroxylase
MRPTEILDAEARARYSGLIDAFLREGRRDIAAQCAELAVQQGFWDDPLQRPLDFVQGASTTPFYDPAEFWLTDLLAANHDRIRAEVDEVAARGDTFAPVEEPLLGAGRWDQVVLYEDGRRQDRACALFPVTTEIVEQIPEATTLGPGVVTLSWLHPDTHVVPHCGGTNARLRVHLGLRVPTGVSIRVGEEERSWQEGGCLVFDDSFEHEVWHRGTADRIVLLLDVPFPGLTKEQQERLISRRRSATERIAGYMAEHGLRRIETDEKGTVLRPVSGTESLIRRYMAETQALAVEAEQDGLRFVRSADEAERGRQMSSEWSPKEVRA